MSDQSRFPEQPQQNWGAPSVNPGAMQGMPGGPVGKIRSTGICILLLIVSCGIYSIVYYYLTHEEMKRHSNQGLGGVVAAILAFFVGIVSPFLLSAEVGNLRESRGQESKVSGMTGLWVMPGFLIVVGPLVWFIKTNGALNEYWASQGAQAA